MEGIRMTAAALCITVVITAILFLLLPNEKYRGIMQFAVSLFFLCGLIAPFINGTFSFSLTLPEVESEIRAEKTELATQAYLCGLVEERIAATLSDGLRANGIDFDRITVEIHMDGEGSIFMDRVTVDGVEEKHREAAAMYINAQTGVTPEFAG